MSRERVAMMEAYGATVILTDAAEGMAGAIRRAEELEMEIEGSVIMGQFENPANALAHFETTGPEIWEDTRGDVDIFVAGIGTGGTFTGTARYLKQKNPALVAVAVEPLASPLLSGGSAAPHGIQGIGANFIPTLLDRSLIDLVEDVSEEDAVWAARELARTEGILCGYSGGAALAAAYRLAKRAEFRGKSLAVILPDGGDRYLSSGLFTEERK
jgi:cysteine synthase A